MKKRTTLFVVCGLLISSASAADPLRMISKKITKDLKAASSPPLVVLPFPYSRERLSTGSHLVSERLITYLVQDGATVMERRLLDKILEEQKLWQTGLMGPERATSANF